MDSKGKKAKPRKPKRKLSLAQKLAFRGAVSSTVDEIKAQRVSPLNTRMGIKANV